jgi:hypothetical protein
MDRQEYNAHYNDAYDETDDRYQKEIDWPVDDMYSSPRQSNYHPRLSQSPRLRAEGLITYINIFIYWPATLDIDEEFPSETDEAAQRALRSITPETDLRWENVTDVLQEHRARNRVNKPPKDQVLLDAVERQVAGTVSDEEHDDGRDNGDDEDGHPKTNSNADPKALKFYSSSGTWVTAITKAKEVFRRFTILFNLFPLRDPHLQDAAGILSKVIADLKEEDLTLIFDQRKFVCYHLFIILPLSTEYVQNRDMNIIVSLEFISISYYLF